MSTSVDRSSAQAAALAASPFAVLPTGVDVPGMLAERIGDLYTTEERHRRNERTERMIRKAQCLR